VAFQEFFEKAPTHDFAVGDLVTCSCHGGLAVILRIFDAVNEKEIGYPSMNMVEIWWLRYPHAGVKERIWIHTISRLKKATSENYAPKNFTD
jgi:hypothetical protein